MKKILFLLFHLAFTALGVQGQPNLVPYGDFEGIDPYTDPCCNLSTNTANFYAPPWIEISFSGTFAPNFFKDSIGCDNNIQQSCFNVPTNHYGTQVPYGGLANNKAYVGMTSNVGRRDGIAIQLERPLKKGYTYTLTYRAVRMSSGNPKLEYKFGNSNSWNAADCPNCNSHEDEITQDGGPNQDQWQTISFQFTPEECDQNWLFIRTKLSSTKRQVLIDDVAILETCAPACSGTYGDLDQVVYSNSHSNNGPLTFFNLDNLTDYKLEIFDSWGGLQRTLHIQKPFGTVSWDGKDDQGIFLPNGDTYTWILSIENDCRCKVISGTVTKVADPSVFIVTDGVYLNAFTLYNLGNVTEMDLTIYNSASQQAVRNIHIYNPQSTIAWDAKDNSGADVTPGFYNYQLMVKNECETRYYGNNFYYPNYLDPNDPFLVALFNYNPVTKPYFSCPFSYNYGSYDRSPKPCCSTQPNISLQNVNIAGQRDYIAMNNITILPTVTAVSGSDVLFQAGNNIDYSGLQQEAGATVDIVIAPCSPQSPWRMPAPTENVTATALPVPVAKEGEPISSEVSYIVFPNPNNGHFTLQLRGFIEEKPMLTLANSVGKIVKRFPVMVGNSIDLDITELPKGIYFLRMQSKDGKVIVEKIIFQ